MALRDRRLVVGAPEHRRHTPSSIDLFLRSLAEAERGRAIGCPSVRHRIRTAPMAPRDPRRGGHHAGRGSGTARFPAMPRAPSPPAPPTACSRSTLSPRAGRAEPRLALARRRRSLRARTARGEDDQLLAEIFALVLGASGVDFSQYKTTTFRAGWPAGCCSRRAASIPAYLVLLRAEPAEVAALGRVILVT
jgi:hypothetical protein